MVVHLSPKAKALTLPLNWSQFLKTLIGAENYTLFQLPPNKTGVRPSPSSFTRLLYTLLPLVFSSFAWFLPLGYFFLRHEQSFEISEIARWRASRTGGIFIERYVVRYYVDQLRDEVSVVYEMKSLSVNISPASVRQLHQSSSIRQVGSVAQKVTGLDVRLKRSSAATLLTSSSSPVARRERLEMSHKIK